MVSKGKVVKNNVRNVTNRLSVVENEKRRVIEGKFGWKDGRRVWLFLKYEMKIIVFLHNSSFEIRAEKTLGGEMCFYQVTQLGGRLIHFDLVTFCNRKILRWDKSWTRELKSEKGSKRSFSQQIDHMVIFNIWVAK